MKCRVCHRELVFYRTPKPTGANSKSARPRANRTEAAHVGDELPMGAVSVADVVGNTTEKGARRRLEENCTVVGFTDIAPANAK